MPTDRLLVDLLRDDLGMTGVKQACDVGACGVGAVIVDDLVVSSCWLPDVMLDGSAVETR